MHYFFTYKINFICLFFALIGHAKLFMIGSRVLGHGGGVIQGTASEAVLVVLLAARDKILRKVGKDAIRKLVVYFSDQTHASLQKACKVNCIFNTS